MAVYLEIGGPAIGSAEGDTRMTPQEPAGIGFRTLADRLSEGRMPAPEALRYARLLGEALREVHGGGKVHGAVSSESVVLTGAGIQLSPASAKLESHATDVSTDIYAFGALLHEMLTGRKGLGGGDGSVPAPTGIPAADRLIAGCLAKEHPARLLSMRRALLELKLATLAARRAEAPAVARSGAAGVALRAGMQQLEARLAARLTALEHSIDALEVKQAADIQRLGADIRAQAAITKSVLTSVAQTEDLVERVVEAMGTIQDSILDQANTRW